MQSSVKIVGLCTRRRYSPPYDYAKRNYIKTYNLNHMYTIKFRQILIELNPDILISAGFPKKIPSDIFSLYPSVNLHPGLPEYRGRIPERRVLENKETETGVMCHKLTEKIDEGKIFYLRKIPIKKGDNEETLKFKLAKQMVMIVGKLEQNFNYHNVWLKEEYET